MDKLHATIREFATHCYDYIPEIPVLHYIPTTNEFLKDYLIRHKPFVINTPDIHLPAIEEWKEPFYLEKRLFKAEITVGVTPILRPEIVTRGRFMEPEVRKMNCYDFLLELQRQSSDSENYFVDKENNLREFLEIAKDIESHVPWASKAFGNRPVSSRLIIGNMPTVTSMHNEQFENFFFVLRGWKEFKLFPPIAHVCLPYKKYKKFQWKKNVELDVWEMIDLKEEKEWISPDLQPLTLEANGFYRCLKSYVVKVHAGEVLYIPALWFYESHQSDCCVTLNHWYETKWDSKFPFLRFLTKLFKIKKPTSFKDASVDIQSEFEESLFKSLVEDLLKK